MPRLFFTFALVFASTAAGCGDDREVREWRAEDHAQPQAGVNDGRTAPDGTPTAFDEASAVASLWRVRCASCHGEGGRGDGLGIPPGAQVKDLTDPEWQASVTDEEIAQVIAVGRGMMPRFDDSINERGISGLVVHIRGFAPAADRAPEAPEGETPPEGEPEGGTAPAGDAPPGGEVAPPGEGAAASPGAAPAPAP